MFDDGFPTASSVEQSATEAAVFEEIAKNPEPILGRKMHAEFLLKALIALPRKFECLDASRPWFVYWITHALDLLGGLSGPSAIPFLLACQSPSGGFGGGPFQLPHLAPTFAAVSAIVIAYSREHTEGFQDARKGSHHTPHDIPNISKLNRPGLQAFLMALKIPTGGFKMHEHGESDMRGTYCAIAVASMLGLLTHELTENVAEYVLNCQTFEGGIAAHIGGAEAHGGYMYCGIASLGILSRILGKDWFKERRKQFDKMRWWCLQRQCVEGGFNGRAGKLVDSCYSFWIGASLAILNDLEAYSGQKVEKRSHDWARVGLEGYVLCACQNPTGGVRDKPGKSPDYYHTCYGLSGLAVTGPRWECSCTNGGECELVGNQLHCTSALYNVRPERIAKFQIWLAGEQKIGESGWLV